jgi:hypothetical protein
MQVGSIVRYSMGFLMKLLKHFVALCCELKKSRVCGSQAVAAKNVVFWPVTPCISYRAVR